MFIKDVSRPGPYRTLHVDPVERYFWRERFLGMGAGPWVGLCWRSGVGGAGRSQFYSRAEDVVRALGAGTANYVNLVYDFQPEELDAARKLDGCVIYDPENIDQKNELDRGGVGVRIGRGCFCVYSDRCFVSIGRHANDPSGMEPSSSERWP